MADTEKLLAVTLRLDAELTEAVENYRRQQIAIPSRVDAITMILRDRLIPTMRDPGVVGKHWLERAHHAAT